MEHILPYLSAILIVIGFIFALGKIHAKLFSNIEKTNQLEKIINIETAEIKAEMKKANEAKIFEDGKRAVNDEIKKKKNELIEKISPMEYKLNQHHDTIIEINNKIDKIELNINKRFNIFDEKIDKLITLVLAKSE